MNPIFSYTDFDECLAHFKAHPPEGETMALDLSDEVIKRLHEHAARHDCTVDAFVNAVLAYHIGEIERQDRERLNREEGI